MPKTLMELIMWCSRKGWRCTIESKVKDDGLAVLVAVGMDIGVAKITRYFFGMSFDVGLDVSSQRCLEEQLCFSILQQIERLHLVEADERCKAFDKILIEFHKKGAL